MRILVVEDEEQLAMLVRRMLTNAHYEAEVALDGPTGLSMALTGNFDLLILDLMLPGIDGIEICRTLRAAHVGVPILMLTARGAVEDRVAGLEVGADDYLTKPFAMQELLARVKALLRRGQAPAAQTQLKVEDLVLDLVRHEARRADRGIELTAKEFALLEYLMRHPGQVLTRAQIVEQVWEYDSESLSNVVDTYIHYLRNKIDLPGTKPLIKTVRGVGYRLGG